MCRIHRGLERIDRRTNLVGVKGVQEGGGKVRKVVEEGR